MRPGPEESNVPRGHIEPTACSVECSERAPPNDSVQHAPQTDRGTTVATHEQPDFELMRKTERAMASNLRDFVATNHRLLPQVGAACVDFAGGVAAFNGMGSPLSTVKGTGPQISAGDLAEAEAFFRAHGAAAVVIEAAPWLTEESISALGAGGYEVAGTEDVVAATAGVAPGKDLRGDAFHVGTVPLAEWPELMRRSYELPDEPAARELVAAAAHLPGAHLYGIRDNERWIACAQSIAYDDVVIFGCDGTLPDARGRGAQMTLIAARLKAVQAGKVVVAEVAPGSGSERNYLRSGFQIAYTRAHYIRSLS